MAKRILTYGIAVLQTGSDDVVDNLKYLNCYNYNDRDNLPSNENIQRDIIHNSMKYHVNYPKFIAALAIGIQNLNLINPEHNFTELGYIRCLNCFIIPQIDFNDIETICLKILKSNQVIYNSSVSGTFDTTVIKSSALEDLKHLSDIVQTFNYHLRNTTYKFFLLKTERNHNEYLICNYQYSGVIVDTNSTYVVPKIMYLKSLGGVVVHIDTATLSLSEYFKNFNP